MQDPTLVRIHLRSSNEIAIIFGVKLETVRKWQKQGAPIYKIGKKLQASYFDLWDWIVNKAFAEERDHE